MSSRRTFAAIGTGAVLCVLTGVAIGSATNLNDPDESVGVVTVSKSGSAAPQAVGSGMPISRQVAGLDALRGVVEYERDGAPDIDDLFVGRVELEFGPHGWIERAGPKADYDGDGSTEALRDELAGLAGTEASFLVRLDDDGDEGSVYTVNGLTYRDPTRPAPWLETPPGSRLITEDDILRAAADAVGTHSAVTELEPGEDGPAAWDAEVIDSAGQEYDVELDAAGTVLSVRRD